MSTAETAPQPDEGAPSLLSHLPAILWHRRWFLVLPLLIFSLAGVAAALLLPTVYRSSAVLLVETQELPPSLVGSPETSLIDQRIAKIRQQVLSRGDLIGLIQQNGLYEEERSDKPLSSIIEKMREATLVKAVAADIGQTAGSSKTNTIAFSLSFDYKDPVKAQLVMQSFIERFLEIDATQMAEQATNTVTFLQDQAATLQKQIADIEGQITTIKAQNGAALANAGIATVTSPGSYDAQIAALQRDNAQLAQQANTSQKDPNVASAEAQLASARAIYSDSHPDVRIARQRLEEARRLAAANPSGSGASFAAGQIAANNAHIAALGRARSMEAAQTSAVFASRSRAPVVMEQVAQLESRANTLREQFQEVSTKLLSARSSEKMETEQKGERLSVIDPPVVPDEPSSPNRPLLILGGLALGAFAGLALALLVELILRPIRGVDHLEKLLGVGPLVVVPTLSNKRPRFARLMAWRGR